MVVPKITETRCSIDILYLTISVGVGMAVSKKDTAYKHYTNNPIPTSFSVRDILLRLCCEITGNSIGCHSSFPMHFWKMFFIL